MAFSPQRSYWEKATLIHSECNRDDNPRAGGLTSRSRHWYDLYKLSQIEIGDKALSDIELLKEVVKIKKTFYHAKSARYDDCLERKFRLVPRGEILEQLKTDYQDMFASGMFYQDPPPPSLEEILKFCGELEERLNSESS